MRSRGDTGTETAVGDRIPLIRREVANVEFARRKRNRSRVLRLHKGRVSRRGVKLKSGVVTTQEENWSTLREDTVSDCEGRWINTAHVWRILPAQLPTCHCREG
jgi:hypothetical protein